MSAEATALMRAIRDCPEDDLPRLALADLIEEDGDPDRAALIRVQVELSRTPEHHPRYRELEDHEHRLLAEHEAEWLAEFTGDPTDSAGPASNGLHEWEWERGFVAEVAATPVFMLDRGAALATAHPVRRWRVMSSQEDLEGDLIAAGRRGWAARLDALDLSGWYQTIGELERFLTRSEFGQLRELVLTGRPGLDDLPEILGRAAFRDTLRVLRCGAGGYPGECGRLDAVDFVRHLGATLLTELAVPGTLLTADDVRAILVAPCARALIDLDIADNPGLEPDAWNAFGPNGPRLRRLDLSGTPLGAISLENTLGRPALAELRALGLSRCGSAMANFRALSRSRFWRQAEELRMHDGTAPERAFEPLFVAPDGPPALRLLDLSENFLRDPGAAGLCGVTWTDGLTFLDLSSNYLSDEALRAVAESGRFTRLRTLRVGRNSPYWQDDEAATEAITDVGAVALAEAPSLSNLRVLDVDRTHVTAAGVDALLNGSHWRLTGLGLQACDLSPDAVRVLATSPRLARLTWLDLGHNPQLRGDALMPLAESEYLSPLTELNTRGLRLTDDLRAALRARLGRRLTD